MLAGTSSPRVKRYYCCPLTDPQDCDTAAWHSYTHNTHTHINIYVIGMCAEEIKLVPISTIIRYGCVYK